MIRKGWIGKVLLALGILGPVVGFVFSAYLVSSGQSITLFSREEIPETEYVLTASDFPEPSETGNQLGNRVPDFTLVLEDGNTTTSASLIEANQPTFLFFWATY